MPDNEFLEGLMLSAGVEIEEGLRQPESLIGIFQAFRPDGLPESLPVENAAHVEFVHRMCGIYDAVRNTQRADAMKDAYFIVRNPPMLSSSDAHRLASNLVRQLDSLVSQLAFEPGIELLRAKPSIRVLEGKAPKHPRSRDERCSLLLLLQEQLPAAVEALFPANSLGANLSESLYFVACDRLLRDYLRWPLLEQHVEGVAMKNNFLQDYFELWRHGVKYRIFNDDQIDFYLPRRDGGTLLDVGQFSISRSDNS